LTKKILIYRKLILVQISFFTKPLTAAKQI